MKSLPPTQNKPFRGAAWLALALIAAALLVGLARAQAAAPESPHMPVATLAPQTPIPTPPAPQAARPNAWILVLLMVLCGMLGLLVIGVGAAILLVRLREKIRT